MSDIEVNGPSVERSEEVLTPDALAFVAELQRRFGSRRDELLAARTERREEISRTGRLDFLEETADVRAGDWRVAEVPADLLDRRVEITGPTERKMAINALNSGAKVWLADLEDANTPHWHNVVSGQVNLADAVRKTISFTSPQGKEYALKDGAQLPVIMPRPRGWHFDERHLTLDGTPVVAALVDFGLFFFHNAAELVEQGTGPYFYLPKMESHLEARLWNDVFTFAQQERGIAHGTIRATVLIETITAAFEMDEILYELKDHAAGLNAGRWDYLFSMIKNFRDAGEAFTLPDRGDVTMTAPAMRAYTQLLVKTCHRRGAFAMGGMAAFIPSRRDEAINTVAFAKVTEDKTREVRDGFDGSWVAHPDLVPLCAGIFDDQMGTAPEHANQLDNPGTSEDVTADQLLAIAETPGGITEAGLRDNITVALQYLEAWLRGNGAVGIHNLMEDAATAEISRSQIWQWSHGAVKLESGETVTPELVRALVESEVEHLRDEIGPQRFDAGEFATARELFEKTALDDDFVDFLTLPAYDAVVAAEQR